MSLDKSIKDRSKVSKLKTLQPKGSEKDVRVKEQRPAERRKPQINLKVSEIPVETKQTKKTESHNEDMTEMSRMSGIKESWLSGSDMLDPFGDQDIFESKPKRTPNEKAPKRQKTTFKRKLDKSESESHSFTNTESATRSKKSSDRRTDPNVAKALQDMAKMQQLMFETMMKNPQSMGGAG